MTWNKPRNVWQWMVLFTPAIAAIFAGRATQLWMPPIQPLHLANGQNAVNYGAIVAREIHVAIDTISALSIVIALAFTRGPSLLRRLAGAIAFTIPLIFVNAFVAFGGCVLSTCVYPLR